MKGARFFDGAVRVPLVMHWPGRYKAGLRSGALVESIDIAPTLLEAAGIPVPWTMQGKSLDGILRGAAPADHHKDMVFCEFIDSMGKLYTPDHTRATMTFDGRYKLVSYYGHNLFELFDLEEDPGEFDNLWDDPRYRDLRWEFYRKQNDALAFNAAASAPRTMLF
jgi:arylsulfatase A-like enzyme